MATLVASLEATLNLTDNMTPGLKKADGNLSKFGGKLTATGDKLKSMGAKMTLWTAPLAAGLFFATNSAANFDKAMTNSAAILGFNAEEMEELNEQILDMGRNSVAGPQAVAEAFFTVVSGVEDATTHMDIMAASIATAEAGQADLAATTNALVGVMNAYGFSAAQAADASDIMTATVGAGVLTMDELAAALPNVSGLAASLGIDFAELGGSIALITKSGTSAGAATTQLQAAMTALIKPNDKMKAALAEMGFESGAAALEALGLQGTLQELSETTIAADNGMGALLGSTEALNASLALTKDGAKEWLANFRGIPTAAQKVSAEWLVLTGEAKDQADALKQLGVNTDGFADATDRARAIQLASPAAQFALLKSEVKGAAVAIGQKLLPILAVMATDLKPLIADVVKWVDENPELTRQILLMAGAMVILGPALALVGAGIGLITSPLFLLAAGILGIIFLADELAKALGFEGIGDALQIAVESWVGIFGQVRTIINELLGLAGRLAGIFLFKTVPDALKKFKDAANKAFGFISGIAADLAGVVIEIVDGIVALIAAARDAAAFALNPFGIGSGGDITGTAQTGATNVAAGVLTPGGGGGTDSSVSTAAAQAAIALWLGLPQQAEGGPVTRGQSVIVGDGGEPEVFTPGADGFITPFSKLNGAAIVGSGSNSGAGGSLLRVGTMNFYGVQNVEQLMDEIERKTGFRAMPATA